jgi:hypothetical protein
MSSTTAKERVRHHAYAAYAKLIGTRDIHPINLWITPWKSTETA